MKAKMPKTGELYTFLGKGAFHSVLVEPGYGGDWKLTIGDFILVLDPDGKTHWNGKLNSEYEPDWSNWTVYVLSNRVTGYMNRSVWSHYKHTIKKIA